MNENAEKEMKQKKTKNNKCMVTPQQNTNTINPTTYTQQRAEKQLQNICIMFFNKKMTPNILNMHGLIRTLAVLYNSLYSLECNRTATMC